MKTTPLDEVLKKITPLPRILPNGLSSLHECPEWLRQSYLDEAYAIHAQNTLPGLVKAVDDYLLAQCQSERRHMEARDVLDAALAKAANVEGRT